MQPARAGQICSSSGKHPGSPGRSQSVRLVYVAVAIAVLVQFPSQLAAQNGSSTVRVELQSAPLLELPGEVDSNSPAVWQRVGGRNLLFIMTSMAGQPWRSWGAGLTGLGTPRQVALGDWPEGGIWMEAVVRDDSGAWYGYYHNEVPAAMCRAPGEKVVPRIGSARSVDQGATWQPLGLILEAPPRTYNCATDNKYFVGGVGDFSVQLDPQSRDLYFFYSLYMRSLGQQGVGVARLAWADRDDPGGKITIWRNGVWLPATGAGSITNPRWIYPAGSPIFPAAKSWHDDNEVDAFWGPSVHWNSYLSKYVMLLNRAKDVDFNQEGIYVSFASGIENPAEWSAPAKILNGGRWYPQVMGIETGTGTDKTAGQVARFYMAGKSQHVIRFIR